MTTRVRAFYCDDDEGSKFYTIPRLICVQRFERLELLKRFERICQTSSCNVCNARRINSRLNALSFSGASSGLPVGLTMPPEAMARSEPTSFATGIIVQICVTGISSFSISLLIAAPQRVLEPQVEVRITPVTPADLRRAAIA